MRRYFLLILFCIVCDALCVAQTVRERVCMDRGWQFALGNAASPEKDFGCGTEYFNYLTKANSIHNEGPYSKKFDSTGWQAVDLPHDWAVQLPFAPEASHSHGYKAIGWKYPENSVGWYRKWFVLDKKYEGQQLSLCFDGVFRNSQVWVNGFYCGGEPSGYLSQSYDITDYVNPGDSVLLCVRVDASLEEGWFYEGAGIYRHVWMDATHPLHLKPTSLKFDYSIHERRSDILRVSLAVENNCRKAMNCLYTVKVIDDKGAVVAEGHSSSGYNPPLPQQECTGNINVVFKKPLRKWSPKDPYRYTIRTTLHSSMVEDGIVLRDSIETKFGFRTITFDKDSGLFVNGEWMKIKGACLHQDHAGVGAAIPDELYVWRLKQLMGYGFNAVRSSHNPMSPALLDACDSLGILVIDENRLMGSNGFQKRQLRSMIERDYNHPSIIAWSIGNEEWGIEWNDHGTLIAKTMSDYVHTLDAIRPVTVATSSGPAPLLGVDIAGYNYVMQNPIDEYREKYPERIAYGSEETSGCGTRGIYFGGSEASMPALNREEDKDGCINRIERGWKFYDERPWLLGLFYWTGFDYRGEPNPLKYPATGSEFGILDYCGFPKDEAFYLKAWWTDEPVLHLLPHWNLKGHEKETIDVWAYSNCDEVELYNGSKSLGKKKMPKNGHLSWPVVYKPGALKAVGYKAGKKVAEETIETTGKAVGVTVKEEREGSLTVLTVEARDAKGRLVPDGCIPFTVKVADGTRLLGWGNGNPAYLATEQSSAGEGMATTFNGLAQVLLMSDGKASYTIKTKE